MLASSPRSAPTRSSFLLLTAVALLGAWATPTRAGESLAEVLAEGRKSGALERCAQVLYFEGGAGKAAYVEYRCEVGQEGLTLTFTEHLRAGGYQRQRFEVGPDGVPRACLLEKVGGTATPAQETLRFQAEGQRWVEVGGDGSRTQELGPTVTPMPLVMFLLPQLSQHLPPSLAVRPVFGGRIVPKDFFLRRGEAGKDGIPVAIETPDGGNVMTILIGTSGKDEGRIVRFESSEETIAPLSEAQVKALRDKLGLDGPAPAASPTPTPGSERPSGTPR